MEELLLFGRRVFILVESGRAPMPVALSPELICLPLQVGVQKFLAKIHYLCCHRQRDDFLLKSAWINIKRVDDVLGVPGRGYQQREQLSTVRNVYVCCKYNREEGSDEV